MGRALPLDSISSLLESAIVFHVDVTGIGGGGPGADGGMHPVLLGQHRHRPPCLYNKHASTRLGRALQKMPRIHQQSARGCKYVPGVNVPGVGVGGPGADGGVPPVLLSIDTGRPACMTRT